MTPREFHLRWFNFNYKDQLEWVRVRAASGSKPTDSPLPIDKWFKNKTNKVLKVPTEAELKEFDNYADKIMSGEIKTRILTDEDIRSWSINT